MRVKRTIQSSVSAESVEDVETTDATAIAPWSPMLFPVYKSRRKVNENTQGQHRRDTCKAQLLEGSEEGEGRSEPHSSFRPQ